jgi:hypothetical protein
MYSSENLGINWMRGPMARRLTTNQEILGSIPSVFMILFLFRTRSDIVRLLFVLSHYTYDYLCSLQTDC